MSEFDIPEGYEHTKDIPAAVRAAVLRRDNYRCRRCGKEENLTLHHIIPRGRGEMGGGLHTEDNLVTLCWMPCHMLIEDHKIILRRIKGQFYFGIVGKTY